VDLYIAVRVNKNNERYILLASTYGDRVNWRRSGRSRNEAACRQRQRLRPSTERAAGGRCWQRNDINNKRAVYHVLHL